MNSTQLHYREATRHLEDASKATMRDGAMEQLATAQVHALLAVTAALTELTRQAAPDTLEAVASATGVLAPVTQLHHHAFNAFGSDR